MLVLTSFALLGGCASSSSASKSPSRVTGSGGHFLRYSSKQTVVDLTPDERGALEKIRVHAYPAVDLQHMRDACARMLASVGFVQIETDSEVDIVTGEQHEKLVGKGREILRGLLGMRGLLFHAKPDHKSTYAEVIIRQNHGNTKVWIKLNQTIWSSNGDSISSTVIDPSFYTRFFSELGEALQHPRPDTASPSGPPRETGPARGAKAS